MKFGEIQSAMRTVAAGALLLSAVAALTLGPLLPVVAAESDKDPVTTSAIGSARQDALSCARHRQIHGRRPAARRKGRAGRRSQDRQRGGSLVAARLHHRRRGRPDQRRVLRCRRPAGRFLRHRGQARSQWRARRAQAIAAGNPDRGRRRRRAPDRLGIEPDRGPAGRRNRRATRGRRRTGSSTRSPFAAATR